jgi:hypothetical protein
MRRALGAVWYALAPVVGALVMAACAYDWTFTPLPSGGDAGKDADAGGEVDAGDTSDRAPPPPPLPPLPPGCRSSADCPAPGSTCDFPDDQCGQGLPGVCASGTRPCTAVPGEVFCGCDRGVYSDECSVYGARSDLSARGGCPLKPDYFECGYRQCMRTTHYCEVRGPTGPGATGYQCLPFTASGCPSLDCTCVTPQPSCTCRGGFDSGVTVTCN